MTARAKKDTPKMRILAACPEAAPVKRHRYQWFIRADASGRALSGVWRTPTDAWKHAADILKIYQALGLIQVNLAGAFMRRHTDAAAESGKEAGA
jgi:hypothetical protein